MDVVRIDNKSQSADVIDKFAGRNGEKIFRGRGRGQPSLLKWSQATRKPE